MPAIPSLVLRKESRYLVRRDGTVLKPALLVYRHFDTEHRLDAAPHHFALECIKTLVRSLSELGERNRLGDCNHRRPRVRAEIGEAEFAGARVPAHAAATVATGVSERVLDGFNSPPFLIEHPIADDTANCQFAVSLDRIVFEIFVTAIAVDQ